MRTHSPGKFIRNLKSKPLSMLALAMLCALPRYSQAQELNTTVQEEPAPDAVPEEFAPIGSSPPAVDPAPREVPVTQEPPVRPAVQPPSAESEAGSRARDIAKSAGS